MSLKVYVAGAWVEQHQRARPMIAKLREAGVEITCDWTQAEGDVCSCVHHRQRHAPMTDEVDVLRGPSACADCPCESFNGIGVGGDSNLRIEDRIKWARADLNGVIQADLVWLMAANEKGACGSWVELGAALIARDHRVDAWPDDGRKHIIVSGPKARRTIFTELADKLFDSDDDALAYVLDRRSL